MAETKKKLVRILTLVYLALFPFGQLLRSEVTIFDIPFTLHPVDIAMGLTFLTVISGRFKIPGFYKSMIAFLSVAIFSLIFSITTFGFAGVIKGALYLLRLTSYLFFFVALFNVVKGKETKQNLYNLLIIVSIIVGIFGWYQYFNYPDLRSLFYIGWDDHLYRLIGTFLDPGFTSIILTFGFLLSLAKFLDKKKKSFLIASLFLLLSVAFTYARASYLALLAGVYVISKTRGGLRYFLVTAAFFLFLTLFLPRPEGYGVMLERTHSIYAKLANYGETVNIIRDSPLLGVGFNNMCIARQKFLGDKDSSSHACSGSDSSFLLLLATTGVLGTLTAVKFAYDLVGNSRRKLYHPTFIACGTALIVHSLFVNSLFYPWVMGYMAVLGSIKESS